MRKSYKRWLRRIVLRNNLTSHFAIESKFSLVYAAFYLCRRSKARVKRRFRARNIICNTRDACHRANRTRVSPLVLEHKHKTIQLNSAVSWRRWSFNRRYTCVKCREHGERRLTKWHKSIPVPVPHESRETSLARSPARSFAVARRLWWGPRVIIRRLMDGILLTG